VKRLIRRHGSPAYYKEGGWTDKVEEAEIFNDVVDAVETCVQGGLEDVELVIRFAKADGDIFCTTIR
jgi:hypothetical protein